MNGLPLRLAEFCCGSEAVSQSTYGAHPSQQSCHFDASLLEAQSISGTPGSQQREHIAAPSSVVFYPNRGPSFNLLSPRRRPEEAREGIG